MAFTERRRAAMSRRHRKGGASHSRRCSVDARRSSAAVFGRSVRDCLLAEPVARPEARLADNSVDRDQRRLDDSTHGSDPLLVADDEFSIAVIHCTQRRMARSCECRAVLIDERLQRFRRGSPDSPNDVGLRVKERMTGLRGTRTYQAAAAVPNSINENVLRFISTPDK
jgi:hypothetical protein